MEVKALPGRFGVEVSGTDLSAPLKPEDLRTLSRLLYENGLLVIRDQTLSEAQFSRFALHWGRPAPHALADRRLQEFPEIMYVGNTQEKDQDDNIRNGAVYWHTDKAYEPEPAALTMLYSVKVPENGGQTLFADMRAAYRALAREVRSRIQELRAAHLYGSPNGTFGGYGSLRSLDEALHLGLQPAIHPLVLSHPITGRKALYGVVGTAFTLVGLNVDESESLLAFLRGHVLDVRFRTEHRYRVGDLAMWDTFSTIHSATPIGPSTCERNSRLLYRITIKGKPRFLPSGARRR